MNERQPLQLLTQMSPRFLVNERCSGHCYCAP